MSLFGNKRRDGEPGSEGAPVGSGGLEAATPPAHHSLPRTRGSATENPTMKEGSMANIGKSISIKGDLTGEEDLLVEGKVEGKVELPNNELTIGANGNVEADVHAKTVLVTGRVAGNVSAVERVEIQATGIVDGDVRAPRLIVQEGAVVNGSIQMGEAVAGKGQVTKSAPAKSPGAGLGSSQTPEPRLTPPPA